MIVAVDTDRDQDLEFDGPGGAYSLHTFHVNVSSVSLGVWVRYTDSSGTGTFLSLYRVK